jgi:hypothetical protein
MQSCQNIVSCVSVCKLYLLGVMSVSNGSCVCGFVALWRYRQVPFLLWERGILVWCLNDAMAEKCKKHTIFFIFFLFFFIFYFFIAALGRGGTPSIPGLIGGWCSAHATIDLFLNR